jgi:pilus assembly protein Flp/PilA
MYQLAKRKREEGQGLVEYALILVLVAVVVIVILTLLGNQLNTVFMRVTAGLSGQSITGVGTEYIINSFSVSVSGGPVTNCTVQLNNISVTKLEDGQPVGSGQGVSVSVSASGGGSGAGSGSTNSSGTAMIGSVQAPGSNCSGTVTVTAGSNSRSASY